MQLLVALLRSDWSDAGYPARGRPSLPCLLVENGLTAPCDATGAGLRKCSLHESALHTHCRPGWTYHAHR